MKENGIVRIEVAEFAIAMEKMLQKHDNKKASTYKKVKLEYLIKRLYEELGEFNAELSQHNFPEACAEIIDVANFLMMIWKELPRRGELELRKYMPKELMNMTGKEAGERLSYFGK